jgi:hypothetical protein
MVLAYSAPDQRGVMQAGNSVQPLRDLTREFVNAVAPFVHFADRRVISWVWAAFGQGKPHSLLEALLVGLDDLGLCGGAGGGHWRPERGAVLQFAAVGQR